MNIEKIQEFYITQQLKYIEYKKNIFNKLEDILPGTYDEIEVRTDAGHCILSLSEIFLIKTLLYKDMEEDAREIEQRTKKLEEMKNGKEKGNS